MSIYISPEYYLICDRCGKQSHFHTRYLDYLRHNAAVVWGWRDYPARKNKIGFDTDDVCSDCERIVNENQPANNTDT